jgi:hypothetical protein
LFFIFCFFLCVLNKDENSRKFLFLLELRYNFFLILSWHTSLSLISNGANVKKMCVTLFQSPMETKNTFSYLLLLLSYFFFQTCYLGLRIENYMVLLWR